MSEGREVLGERVVSSTYTPNLIFSSFFRDKCTPCGWSMRNHKIKTPLRPFTSTFIISSGDDQIKIGRLLIRRRRHSSPTNTHSRCSSFIELRQS